MTAVEEWVNGKDTDFFSSGLMALEHVWSRGQLHRKRKGGSQPKLSQAVYLLTRPRKIKSCKDSIE